MTDSKYQCEVCKGVFSNSQSDEEADAEYRAIFPESKKHGGVVVCDECEAWAWLLRDDALEDKDAEIKRLRERVAYLEKAFLTGKRPV